MAEVRWERYPLVARSPHARAWLTIQAHLGRAANTVEAYGRALEDYLTFAARHNVAVDAATPGARRGLRPRPDHSPQPARRGGAGARLRRGTRQCHAPAAADGRPPVLRLPGGGGGAGRQPGRAGPLHARARPSAAGATAGSSRATSSSPGSPSDEQWRAVLAAARAEPLPQPGDAGAGLRRRAAARGAVRAGDGRPRPGARGCCACAPRSPRAAASASSPTPPRPARCTPPTWPTADAEPGARAALPLRSRRTGRSRSRSGPGRRSSRRSPPAPACRSSRPTPCGTSA